MCDMKLALDKKQKRSLRNIIIAALLFAAGFALRLIPGPVAPIVSSCVFAAAYIVVGLEILIKAFHGIIAGELLDENFLMSIASLGAFILGDFAEGVAVMLFYQVGELFQSCAVSSSRKSISGLLELRADHANLEQNGEIVNVDPEKVNVGDIIVIHPGEKIPLDCAIIEGSTSVDTSALTGESLPRYAGVGDMLLGGCVNREGNVRARVEKPFGESTAAKILDLVENSSAKKSKSENFITKFARVYTPAVVVAALLIAVIPPFIFGFDSFPKWIFQGLSFLVISCPCALVISVPLAFFGGIGRASRQGILVKGGSYIETLANLETVVFDKTGTLTRGNFKVTEIHPEGIDEHELIKIAAAAESASSHPIAKSIIEACREKCGGEAWYDVKYITEVAGNGVTCMYNGETIAVGNRRLMKMLGIERDNKFEIPQTVGTVIHVAETSGQSDGGKHTVSRYLGYIVISDEIKENSADALTELRACGIKRLTMLTGDSKAVADAVSKKLGLDEYYAELLPDGKVEKLEELLKAKSAGSTLAFVGDGLNDAPVLSLADVGIAMGGIGSDAAIEAADVVLMDDNPMKIAYAIRSARSVIRISRQNIIFAIGVKALILVCGVFGIVNMWLAVFADVGVAVLAILNSMRAGKVK